MKYSVRFCLALIVSIVLAGCASRADVIRENYRRDFKSAKSPGALAVCIDRNANDYPLNLHKSNITNVDGQPIEVLIRNGETISAVVQIAAADTGSNAVFYMGGASSMFPDTALKTFAKGCE